MTYSCTVYYAQEFDALRRKCGMGGMFVKSLVRCAAWDAEGGKSRAAFFKTDGRCLFIILMGDLV